MEDIKIVKNARKEGRLTTRDYIKTVVTGFLELHGDRYFGDDKAMIGGIGWIGQTPVTVLGIEKGRDTQERILHNFGSAHPEGYRKALRLMKQAEKFHRPIVCFVDTAGAFCGVEAEERGQGRAIAENLYEMSALTVPILSVVVGEGGSGGALALCHADRIWMLEDAYFSVVSPENCANILWKDTARADLAAESLALTADKLYKLGLIDKICKKGMLKVFAKEIEDEIKVLLEMPVKELVAARYQKFRAVGYEWR